MSSANRTSFSGLVIAGAIVVAVIVFIVLLRPSGFEGDIEPMGPGKKADYFDITTPDALIRTRSLSQLPADLLRVPLARDVLTEDFVSYYEHHEQKLSLSGAIRRIAYEHRLNLPESLLQSVFDEPAEVALWRANDGRLKYFVIAMTRNALARALQTVLPVLPDAQLSHAGELGDTDVPVLLLNVGRRQLLLLSRGDRVVVLSHAGMLLSGYGDGQTWPDQDGETARVIARLLDIDADDLSPFATRYGLGKRGSDETHRVVVGADVYTFGYNAFATGIEALDFTFDAAGNWRAGTLVNMAALPASGLDGSGVWAALPHGASLCGLMPVDWDKLSGLAETLDADAEGEVRIGTLFAGPAAVCWYGDSRLYTPLFVATLKAELSEADATRLRELFTAAIGPVDAATPDMPKHFWSRRIDSRHGVAEGGTRALTPGLAVAERTVVFSPDRTLVEKALSVNDKLYPALADSLPQSARTLALVEPKALSALLSREVLAALPRSEEAEFRNAADAYLMPRLETLAAYPPFRLVRGDLPKEGRSWQTLQWEFVSPAGNAQ